MLSARVSTARNAQRLARSFATAVESSGVKVATVDRNQPTSAVTILVKAGSRFESKPGVANGLKNFAFKGTAKRSALGTVRESELYGGVLSSSLTREHLALTAEFLRGDEQFFVDVLSSFVTSAKFTRHEFEEYVSPVIENDTAVAMRDPATVALELAHAQAFRTGLGASLFALPHHSINAEDIKSYAKTAFTKGNMAILGAGIDQSVLAQLVEKSLNSIPATSTVSSTPSSYFGGENRIESHTGPQTVFIGFGASGAPSAELATLAAYLSPQPSIKWSQGLSPIASAISYGTSVQSVYLPYSDATLLGLLIQAPTTDGVKEASKAAVGALKLAASGITEQEFKKAVAKAKFAAASATESREGLLTALGSQILAGNSAISEASLASFDKLTAAAFTKSVSSLIKSKPTYVAVGDAMLLPYADGLGL